MLADGRAEAKGLEGTGGLDYSPASGPLESSRRKDGKGDQDEGASPRSALPCDPPSALVAVDADAAEVWGGEVASLDSELRLARALERG